VSYVRLETRADSVVNAFTAAGVKVDYLITGPYNTGGVCGDVPNQTAANTWAANAVAEYKAHPGIVSIELMSEPGGTWLWGANALSQANSTCYAMLLKTVRSTFDATFGRGNYPPLLASWDGGYSSGPNTWGQEWLSADPNALSYVDAITVHPYGGGCGTAVASSALGHRDNVIAAENQTHMPIYITEVGWPTDTASGCTGDSLQWSEADQATNIYNFIVWARTTSYIKAVWIFNCGDYGPNNWYGIERLDGNHKPSYLALHEAALGLPKS
jgi:hypothetical protein